MGTDDQGELVTVVEEIRAERFSDLPAGLVDEIIRIEAAFVEDRVTAVTKIAALIDSHVAKDGG